MDKQQYLQRWLDKAENDLSVARHESGVDKKERVNEAICFHCQQAVEKSLKAFLAWNDIPFRKTHSIEEIGEACIQQDSTLKDLVDQAVPLTEYAWAFRYPGNSKPGDFSEAAAYFSLAKEIYQAVLSRLPEEIQNLI